MHGRGEAVAELICAFCMGGDGSRARWWPRGSSGVDVGRGAGPWGCGVLPVPVRVGWRTVSPAEKQNTVVVQQGAAASVDRLGL